MGSYDLELFKLLLDNEPWSDKELLSELLDAAQFRHAEIVKELLSRDSVDPSMELYEGRPILGIAVDQGHEDVIDLLLADPRTDPNVHCYSDTLTVLQETAQNGQTHIVRPLLARDASPRPNFGTPIHGAVIHDLP